MDLSFAIFAAPRKQTGRWLYPVESVQEPTASPSWSEPNRRADCFRLLLLVV